MDPFGNRSGGVFLSHITEEAALANVLKDWIETSFGGNSVVFVSSSKTDLRAGSRWLDEIDRALEGSKVYLVLCSPASVNRPWINFEMGCGWIKRVPIIPICHSGQQKGHLPGPISQFMALEVADPEFAETLIADLAKYIGFSRTPRIDYDRMTAEIRGAIGQVLHAPEVAKDLASAPAEERYAAAFANLAPAERFVFSRFLVNNTRLANFTLDVGDPAVSLAIFEFEQHGYLSKYMVQTQFVQHYTVTYMIDEAVFEYLKAHPELWEHPSAESRRSAP